MITPTGRYRSLGRGQVVRRVAGDAYEIQIGYRNLVGQVKGGKPLSNGDWVYACHLDGDPHLVFLLTEKSHGKPPRQGTVIPGDGPVNPPNILPGSWLQQKGYWWNPNHSRHPIEVFNLSSSQEDYVNEPMIKMINRDGEGTGSGEGDFVLFKQNIDYTSPWSIKRDGVEIKSGSSIPEGVLGEFFRLTVTIDANGVPDSETLTGYPENIEPGLYEVFLFVRTDHSGEYTASYKGIDTSSKHIFAPGEIDDAERKTMAFKGLVMFPDGIHQGVSLLTPHFEVAGTNLTSTPIEDKIDFVDSIFDVDPDYGNGQQPQGIFFTLSETPVPGSEVEVETGFSPIEQYNLRTTESIKEKIDDTTYAVKMTLYPGIFPHFYYSRKDGEETRTYNIVSDGSTQTFVLESKTTQYINILLEEIEVPSIEIIEIISATVNLDDDPEAVFFKDEVTFSVPLSDGDEIHIEARILTLVQGEQGFSVPGGGQQLFELGTAGEVEGESLLVRINYMNQGDSGVDSGDTQNYANNCRVIPGTNNVGIYFYFYPTESGEGVTANYSYFSAGAEYYKTSEMRIYELGINGQRIYKTPIEEYILNPLNNPQESDYGRKIEENLGRFREGALYLDANSLSYTIAGPNGLIWRDRTLLTENPSVLANPPVHYNITPWTTEAVSTDWYNTDPNYTPEGIPNPPVKNREHPWYWFHCGGPYGIQGTWNRYGGYVGDTNQFLRLWKQNQTTFVWNNHVNLNLSSLLPADINTAHPPRIQGSGKTDFYNRINGSVFQVGDRKPGRWPLCKNYEAWIVASIWIVSDFENDILHNFDDSNTRNVLDMGWDDAGITFSAINPENGSILSQYTIRPDKTNILSLFTDVMSRMDYNIASGNAYTEQVIDKYINDNPDYYPTGMEPLPPWAGQNTVTSSASWRTIPFDSSTVWRCLSRVTGTETIQRILKYPGAPTFPSVPDAGLDVDQSVQSDDSKCLWNTYSNPESNTSLNRVHPPNIVGDEDNNFYFVLYMPQWQQTQNINTPTRTFGSDVEMVTRSRSIEVSGTDTGSTPNYRIQVYFEGGEFGGGFNLCDGHVTATVNGVDTDHSYPGNDTGFLIPYFYEHVYINSTSSHYDAELDRIVYIYPDATVTVTWKQPVVTGFNEFLSPLANSLEYPSFLGFQTTPMFVTGLAIANGSINVSPDYSAIAKAWLFKINFDSETGVITEKWRKDISQMANYKDGQFWSGDWHPTTEALTQVVDMTANFTLVCGRYICVVKDWVVKTPDSTDGDTLSVRQSVLEVYHNTDTEPDLFKSIVIPDSESPENPSIFQVKWCSGATCDVDAEGREHLFLKMKDGRGIVFIFPAEEGDDPEVQSLPYNTTNGEPDFPEDSFDLSNMGRFAGTYYWFDRGNNLKRRTF